MALVSQLTDLLQNLYMNTFRISVEKIKDSLKSDESSGYFTWRSLYILTISHWILLRMRNVSYENCTETQNTHFVFNDFLRKFYRFFFFLDNVGKYYRAEHATDDNIIRRIRWACWITKATNTHSEYVIIIAFPQQHLLLERALIPR